MKKTLSLLSAFLILILSLLSSCTVSELTPMTEETKEETVTEKKEELPSTTKEVIPEQPNPENDKVLKVLVIGNSFSTGWPDELNGLLAEKEIKAEIWTVYYSGCSLTMHWNWLENGRKNYRLRHHKQEGGTDDFNEVGLDYCLKKRNWDVISLQHDYGATLNTDFDAETFHKRANLTAKKLYDYIRERYPKSRLVFHEEWAYNVGWSRNGKSVATKEVQEKMYHNIHRHATSVHEQNGVQVIPSGTAWQIARARDDSWDMTRDQYHDGPATGGQYLNACVWFESLTGQSCVGSTWRPSALEISAEQMTILQNVAHEAVETNSLK